MSFDGSPRPAQLNPNTGAMNPYLAANLANTDRKSAPLIKSLSKEEKVKAAQREEQQHRQAEADEQRGEAFSEEEADQIRILAKMRGIMNLALESGKRYEFSLSDDNRHVNLIDVESGQVILQLYPEELMELSQKIHRYAGMLTDRAG